MTMNHVFIAALTLIGAVGSADQSRSEGVLLWQAAKDRTCQQDCRAAAPTATLVAAGKLGQERPYGKPVGAWKITVTEEKPGIVNCRAVRKAGQRLDIMAMRNDGTDPYLSVDAEGRKGKFPGTIINVPGQPRGAQEWEVDGEANVKRMWFPMGAVTISEIAEAGAFQFSLPDSEDTGVVLLGKDAPAAWSRVNDCVFANGR